MVRNYNLNRQIASEPESEWVWTREQKH
jgi:hypothetical protein